ncbi:MAG: hypothetical protein ACK42D_01705 [Candidatus Paceibacteria bacterium]
MKRRGELIKVGSLFDKYKNILQPPQSTVLTEVVEVINDVCGVKLQKKYIKYSVNSKTISIVAPSVLKQEVMRKQSEILLHLRGRLGLKAPTKIM